MKRDKCLFINRGMKCSNEQASFSSFCSEHKNYFSKFSNQELLEKTAEYLRGTIYVNKDKKISPVKDKEVWGNFTNCMNDLFARGYKYKEATSAVWKMVEAKGLFDDINKALGRDPKWKKFEKIIAGIHFLKSEGADVKFNDSIKGKRTGRNRQIDVSLRFKHGYYEYLAIVECKDLNQKVPIRAVEAFNTKIEDVGAQKGIMVSTKGFQEGAIETAKAYDIDLFTLTEEIGDWTRKIREDAIRVPFYKSITLDTPPIPQRPKYNSESLKLTEVLLYEDDKTPPTSLGRILVDVCTWAYNKKISLPCIVDVKFSKEMFTKFPGTDIYTPVYGVDVELVNTEIIFSHKIDLPPKPVKFIYSDIAKKNKYEIPVEEVPLGIDTIFEVGKFYTNRMKMKYRCNRLEGNKATMMLLESRQYGRIIDVEFVQDISYACYYIPLNDQKEVDRLEKRYQNLKKSNKD